MTTFYVTYPSRFTSTGKVHKLSCRYAESSHGRKLTHEQLGEQAPNAEDCKVCGGAS